MSNQERVLVIPEARFRAAGEFTGFRRFEPGYRATLLDPGFFEFRPRAEVEDDPGFKQLVPYVVLRHGGRVFHYRRAGGGEARLRARSSVGIGGHVNESDAVDGDVYRAGMAREVAEEVDIRCGWAEHDLGFIYDPSVAVGTVHLGVVHLFELEAPEVTAREAGIAGAGFATPADLAARRGEFETWSQLVIAALLDG